MILYTFRRCPYAIRARLAILASGTPVEHREVALSDKPAALLAASPKGTVPVLVLPDGRVIDQSLDIMRWALARHDSEHWLAGDDATLIARFDDRFKHHLDRTKYADRHDSDLIEHRTAACAMLGGLEERLATTSNLTRDTRALADMAIFPFVRQFAAIDPVWFAALPIPRVQAWLARHLASPLFDRAMARPAPWVPGDPAVMLDEA